MGQEIKLLLDSSYFSNILAYYPLSEVRFKFVWDALKEKITNKEIILLDIVYKELQDIKDPNTKKILTDLKKDIIKTNIEDYKKIADLL